MYLQGFLAAAIGIQHESGISIITLLDQSGRTSVSIERPVYLVMTVNNLGKSLTIQQQDTINTIHGRIGKSSAQRK